MKTKVHLQLCKNRYKLTGAEYYNDFLFNNFYHRIDFIGNYFVWDMKYKTWFLILDPADNVLENRFTPYGLYKLTTLEKKSDKNYLSLEWKEIVRGGR